MRALRAAGHDVNVRFKLGCSLIHVARNDIANLALADGVDAIIWVDADMAGRRAPWGASWVMAFLSWAAAYLQKDSPEELDRLRADDKWPVRDPKTRLAEVSHVGTGLLFTQRVVYEKIAAATGQDYFNFIHPLGEDSSFCKRWRDVGGQVWVDPDIVTAHIAAPGHHYVGHFAEDLDAANASKLRLRADLLREERLPFFPRVRQLQRAIIAWLWANRSCAHACGARRTARRLLSIGRQSWRKFGF